MDYLLLENGNDINTLGSELLEIEDPSTEPEGNVEDIDRNLKQEARELKLLISIIYLVMK